MDRSFLSAEAARRLRARTSSTVVAQIRARASFADEAMMAWARERQTDPAALGYTLTAFTTLDIDQSRMTEALDRLQEIPEVLEAHVVTGVGTLLCRLAARSYTHLSKIIHTIQSRSQIRRSSTAISLQTVIPLDRELGQEGRALLALLVGDTEITVGECARRLALPRETIYQQFEQLDKVIRSPSSAHPDYTLTAFATLTMDESGPDDGLDPKRGLTRHLAAIPEVLETHLITGAGDLLCQLVARDHAHLHQVINSIAFHHSIVDSSTAISLETPIPYRVMPLASKRSGAGRATEDASSGHTTPPSTVGVGHGKEPDRRKALDYDSRALLGLRLADPELLINMIDPRVLGYPMTAFTTLEIHQGGFADVLDHLREIPPIVEAYWVAGTADLLCRLVARDHTHLTQVIRAMCSSEAIVHPSTAISLETVIPYRVSQLAIVADNGMSHEFEQRSTELDRDERALLGLLAANPNITAVECARQLGISPVEVDDRLRRLGEVIRWSTHHIDPATLGYAVTAFTTLDMSQRGRTAVDHNLKMIQDRLRGIPQILEAHLVTGAADLICQFVANDHDHLARLIRDVSSDPVTVGTSTTISLEAPIPYRVLPLIKSDYLR